jgi:lysophospholipase L1-like esterase
MKKIRLMLCLLLFSVVAKTQPFANSIAAFKKQDSISPPGANQILFVGSSSFTNWKDVQDYFPEHKIINKGFGGSTLTDVIYYADQIIIPYHPKQVIIYCGENDIAGDTLVSGKTVFKRFKALYKIVRNKLGNVPIAYISMKPSPSRWHLRSKMITGNNHIQKFLSKKNRNGQYVSVWDAMLAANGEPALEIFLEDKLHMNKAGYVIWQKIIEPFLIK